MNVTKFQNLLKIREKYMNDTSGAFALKLWYLAKSKDNLKIDECWYLLRDYNTAELMRIKEIWKAIETDMYGEILH